MISRALELALKFAAMAGFGVFCLEPVPLQLQMLRSIGLGEGSAQGQAIYQAQGPCKQTAPQSKGNFSLSAEHSTRSQLWLWELAFRRHSPVPGQRRGTGDGRKARGR